MKDQFTIVVSFSDVEWVFVETKKDVMWSSKYPSSVIYYVSSKIMAFIPYNWPLI